MVRFVNDFNTVSINIGSQIIFKPLFFFILGEI